MRKLSQKETSLLNQIIDFCKDRHCTGEVLFKHLQIHSTEELLTVYYLLNLLSENGYIYLIQFSSANGGLPPQADFYNPTSDPNLSLAIKGLYDYQYGEIVSFINKTIVIPQQLLELQATGYKTIEEQQLSTIQALLNEAQKQSQEAKNQTDEARKQTTEALNQTREAIQQTSEALEQTKEAKKQTDQSLKQTQRAIEQVDESKKQTRFSLGSLIASIFVLLISIISLKDCSHAESKTEGSSHQTEITLAVDTSISSIEQVTDSVKLQ